MNPEYSNKESTYEIPRDPRELNVVERIRHEEEIEAALPRLNDDHVCVDTLESSLASLKEEVAELKNDKMVEEVREVLAEGGDIKLESTISVKGEDKEDRNVIELDTTLDFGANIIRLDIPNADASTGNWIGAEILGGDVVFNGTTGGIVTAANGELYAVVVRNGATLTVNGGTYLGGSTAVQSIEGIITINGGFFKVQTDEKQYTLNCIDKAYKEGRANFIIKGGTFVDFDPSDNLSEGPHTNYVAEGYKVIPEVQANGETWYTVVPA